MGTRTDAVFVNRAEKLILAASALLVVPSISTDARAAVAAARDAVRRELNTRESVAAAPSPEAGALL